MSRNWSLTEAPNGLLVQDNPWGALRRDLTNWDLTIRTGGRGLATADFMFPEFDPRYVLAYPCMIYGQKFGSTPDTSNGVIPMLGKNAGSLSVHYDWQINNPSTDAQYNVAIETYFHDGLPITGPGHPSGQNNKMFELMIWLDRPKDTSMFFGKTRGKYQHWNIQCFTGRDDYVAFIPKHGTPPNMAGQLNILPFILAAEEALGVSLQDKPMSALELGPEIWAGSGQFQWNRFDVIHNPNVVHNTDSDSDGKKLCLTREQYQRLAIHHHQLSVQHNGIAKLYEEISK